MLSDGNKRDSDLFRYCIQQMAAVPAASDALTRYNSESFSGGIDYRGRRFRKHSLEEIQRSGYTTDAVLYV